MADIKDRQTAAPDSSTCDTGEADRTALEPWSEERARRCEEWMEKFVGRYKLGFEVDVQEYFEKYAE
ncbi:MAG: hypothetical protein R6V07_20005 [Armatimonadota bacterium]